MIIGRMGVWFKTLLLFVVFDKAQLYRQLVNITCLELAKPSNQQFRLSCNDRSTYHCLLNGDSTEEFEICKTWKWIPEGNCAYINTYGWNIDARSCSSSAELACPKMQYRSEDTIIYSACYIRNNPTTIRPLTSLTQVTSNMTSDENTATSFSDSEAWIIFFLYIISIAVVLSISMIYIHIYMGKRLSIKEKFTECVEDPLNNYDTGNANTAKRQVDDQVRAGNKIESDKDSRVSSESLKKELPTTDENDFKDDQEKPADSTNGSYLDQKQFEDEEEDEKESTDIFDDTFESFQQIQEKIDEQDREQCTYLYNLLNNEGLELTQEVLAANITRETGKEVNKLLNSFTDQEKNKLKEMLPEESHRTLKSKEEQDTSFHVSYGLHQIFLDEKKSPKSGWGNPVRGKDIGIGDDVERLNRIHTIVQGISNPVTVSVESYIRLLDIMIKALTRLDPDGKFKDGYKAIAYKVTSIKKQTLTQIMSKNIREFLWK